MLERLRQSLALRLAIQYALVCALGDIGERLRADQIILGDLLGHHLEQQPVFGRPEWRRLAGVLDAGNRLLDRSGCSRGG